MFSARPRQAGTGTYLSKPHYSNDNLYVNCCCNQGFFEIQGKFVRLYVTILSNSLFNNIV